MAIMAKNSGPSTVMIILFVLPTAPQKVHFVYKPGQRFSF
jgi:hypothetical protein